MNPTLGNHKSEMRCCDPDLRTSLRKSAANFVYSTCLRGEYAASALAWIGQPCWLQVLSGILVLRFLANPDEDFIPFLMFS